MMSLLIKCPIVFGIFFYIFYVITIVFMHGRYIGSYHHVILEGNSCLISGFLCCFDRVCFKLNITWYPRICLHSQGKFIKIASLRLLRSLLAKDGISINRIFRKGNDKDIKGKALVVALITKVMTLGLAIESTISSFLFYSIFLLALIEIKIS